MQKRGALDVSPPRPTPPSPRRLRKTWWVDVGMGVAAVARALWWIARVRWSRDIRATSATWGRHLKTELLHISNVAKQYRNRARIWDRMLIFIDFHRFSIHNPYWSSLLFIDFQYPPPIEFHWFSMIFIDFQYPPPIEFHWLSSIFKTRTPFWIALVSVWYRTVGLVVASCWQRSDIL